MSDSEDLSSATNIPADAEIETCLRTVVREAVKKEEQVTIKLARTRAEQELGLDAGFLKDNAQWKERSKELINAAFEEPSSPEARRKAPKAPKPEAASKACTKRKLNESQPSRKKSKKSNSEDEAIDSADERSELSGDDEVENKSADGKLKRESESEAESAVSDPPEDGEQSEVKPPNGNNAGEDGESELSSVIDEPAPKKKRQNKTATKAESKAKAAKSAKPPKAETPAEDAESDLSSVIDEPQPKKARKKKPTSPNATSKARAKPAATKHLSPEEEEIKRLQSWLLKCGVRKLWHRELAPFDTATEKIKHLKSMLEEVGMTGRYSAEKAKQIKEARELKAELEAATEFNKTWGHGSDEEDGEDGKNGDAEGEAEKPAPGKRVRPKGFVDFGDSDEESD